MNNEKIETYVPMTSVVYCRTFLNFMSSLFNNFKKTNSENVSTRKYDFERRLCAQTQDLQIFEKFNMS